MTMKAVREKPAVVDPVKKTAVAFKAVLKIGEKWGLTEEQIGVLLGGVAKSSVNRWRAQLKEEGALLVEFGPDVFDRIGYLLGIYKALNILFPDSGQADGWVKRPNKGVGFDGESGLDRMLRGGMDDLRFVRGYLDGWRG